jgi:acetylornithine deacetylase/succinyl-diaminopimelate desuccinylase-like protein
VGQGAGCSIKVDQLGNIFVRREGRHPSKPPVMTGSHLDTQPTGGKFDGAYRADQFGQARLPALLSITSLE